MILDFFPEITLGDGPKKHRIRVNDNSYVESLGWNVITQEDLFQLDVRNTGATRLIYSPLRDWHCAINWQAIAQVDFQIVKF